MLTRDGGRLALLDSFRVDRSLPKHMPTTRDNIVMEQATKYSRRNFSNQSEPRDSLAEVGTEDDFTPSWVVGETSITVTTRDGVLSNIDTNGAKKPFFLFRWWHAFWGAFSKAKKEETPPPQLTTFELFRSLKNSVEELEVIAGIAQRYESSISQALKGGQKALAEKLTKNALVRRTEAQLVACGLTEYLEEEVVVEFVKKAEKGVRLDWVANFTRPIPSELVSVKRRCDDLLIFDNYAVMHYDPQGKSWAETEEERKAREAKQRDPILFGLIKDSRRLYYLGDWEDDTCNLTMDELARVMGGTVSKELTE